MIPEITQIIVALRNYESQYEQVLENAQNIQTQYISLQQAYNILQSRYNDLEIKYNNLLNDKQNTDNKKPQEEIPEVSD